MASRTEISYVPTGHRWRGKIPGPRVFPLPRGTGCHFGYVHATRLDAAVCQLTVDRNPVYDVSNRETFQALPRWCSELDTYAPESVVKIIVGNKVDKVRRSPPPPSPLLDASAGILSAGINI